MESINSIADKADKAYDAFSAKLKNLIQLLDDREKQQERLRLGTHFVPLRSKFWLTRGFHRHLTGFDCRLAGR